jgi:metal-dependent hydrolase (beta-lactamase superfamily II)
MKIKFISQASVIIETEDAKIWTDPWLFGTSFNDSWKLYPAPEFDENLLEDIDFLWISHEHPDHFHIPTLKSLPDSFKKRVTLLFQNNNSDKMPNAFKMLGFDKIELLNNRKVTRITQKTEVHNYQVGQMDSSLAVISMGNVILNLNDCEINKNDAKKLSKDLGKIDILLNQVYLLL